MSFTTATVTHTFQNADGTPASGSVLFSLSKRITNGSSTILPGEVTATLNGSGHISQALTANDDVGTIPADSQWRVDLQIAGAAKETFFVTVPTGGGSVDLGTLLPQQPDGA